MDQECGGSVLVIKQSGTIRAAYYLDQMLVIKNRITKIQPKGLLLDWTELVGWDEEAESIRFIARLELRSSFARVAILADKPWGKEISRLKEVSNLPIRQFSDSDRQSALAWLESGS